MKKVMKKLILRNLLIQRRIIKNQNKIVLWIVTKKRILKKVRVYKVLWLRNQKEVRLERISHNNNNNKNNKISIWEKNKHHKLTLMPFF